VIYWNNPDCLRSWQLRWRQQRLARDPLNPTERAWANAALSVARSDARAWLRERNREREGKRRAANRNVIWLDERRAHLYK
jgi:hypothetical protein